MDNRLIPANQLVTLDNACVAASFVIMIGYLLYYLLR